MTSLALLSVFLMPPSVQGTKDALRVAIARVEHQQKSIVSWRIRYTNHVSGRPGGTPGATGIQTNTFEELRKEPLFRTRMLVDIERGDKLESVKAEHEDGFDGMEYRAYTPERNSGGFSTKDGVNHSFIGLLYGVDTNLGDLLQKVEDEGFAEWTTIEGRKVLKCVWFKSEKAEYAIYLDPQHAWQPVRKMMEQEVLPGVVTDGHTKEWLAFDVKAYIERDGVTVPSEIRFTTDYLGGNGQRFRKSERRVVVSSLEINPKVKDSDFRIEFPEGTRVRDMDREVIYIQGKPGSEKPVNSRPPESSPKPMIAATGAQRFWWSDSRMWLGITGLLAMLTAIAYWRQKRALSRP
jgi:hypothetical protein